MKGTRWAIRPATNATSRESRSSLATTTLHFAAFAVARAAASWGRLSRASKPFPVSASTYSAAIVRDSLEAKRSMAARWWAHEKSALFEAQLPTRPRGECMTSARLAEGEELGSNLLRVARSNQGNPADRSHLAGG
jgi:hypothetical protein